MKFENFSINTSNSSAPEVNLSLLPVETSCGTGYPPIKHSLLCSDLLWLVREGGAIEAFSVSENKLTETVVFPFAEGRSVIELFALENDQLMAVSSHGDVAFWSLSNLSVTVKTLSNVKQVQAAAKKGNFLAVGGMGSKNNLKVFNLDDLTVPLYSAKPTTDTRLNRPFNIDIRAICFTSPDDKPEKIAITNADGQIFLYDFALKASSHLHRQVLAKKSVLTSITRVESDGNVIYTDVTGVIERYDLIKGKSCGRFNSQEGAVTSVVISGNDSIVLVAAKDRFLRVFNLSTRALLHKVFLKHVPSTITVVRQDWLQAHSQQYEDSEDEQVWEGMTRISDKKKRPKLQE